MRVFTAFQLTKDSALFIFFISKVKWCMNRLLQQTAIGFHNNESNLIY